MISFLPPVAALRGSHTQPILAWKVMLIASACCFAQQTGRAQAAGAPTGQQRRRHRRARAMQLTIKPTMHTWGSAVAHSQARTTTASPYY
jgi:hypothetical protein